MRRRKTFHTLALSATLSAALSATFSACSEYDADGLQSNSTGKEYNTFDFSTSEAVDVSLQYTIATKSPVFFRIYDQDPGTNIEEGNSYDLDESIEPIYSGFTNSDGSFSKTINVAAGTEKLYIYSPSFFAPTLLTADISNGAASAEYDSEASQTRGTRSVYSTDQEYDSYILHAYNWQDAASKWEYRDGPWKDWLVTYDKKNNGHVTNLYKGGELAVEDPAKLFSAHQLVINVNKECPQEYRASQDLIVTKDAEVALTFLGGNTCWSSSLGYYYYFGDNKPKSLSDANVVMVFPNTQNGAAKVTYNRIDWDAYKQAGINTGDCVQLMYYPNIASGSKEGATTVFPMGCRIGLVLATNAWSNRMTSPSWGSANKQYRSCTTPGLSVNNSGVAYSGSRTAQYTYDNYVMVSFEDHIDDENFSDVVVTMTSNPVKAIESTNKVDESKLVQDIYENKGAYLFEDLWPSKGDYDLNDVMIKMGYTKTVDTQGRVNVESYDFTSYRNVGNATKTNGLAARITGIQGTDQLKFYRKLEGKSNYEEIQCTYEANDGIVVLTNNAIANCKDSITYRVSILHSGFEWGEKTKAEPFIWRDEEGGRWEVHLIDHAPSSKANMSLFGTQDDASDIANGKYYRRNGNYPFALHLESATKANLITLIRSDGNNISNVYPRYDKWVNSNGTKYQYWYRDATGAVQ